MLGNELLVLTHLKFTGTSTERQEKEQRERETDRQTRVNRGCALIIVEVTVIVDCVH